MKTHKKRGAVLITAVILAMGVAIALGTFIALSVQTARLSNSSFHFNSALNLAEAGLERAMVAINAGDFSWSSRTFGGTTALSDTFGPFDLGNGTEGYVDVAIFDHTTRTPRVVAQGRTSGNLGSTVRKQIEIYLRQRSDFENGLVAKNKIRLVGNNVTIDSYDSEDPTASTNGQYDYAKRNDNGSVASAIVKEESTGADLGNADIWGMVATSGSQIVYKPNGTVLGENSAADGYTKVDPNRVTQDFVGEFNVEDAPTGSGSHYNSETDMPTDGTDSYVLGADGAATYVTVDKIALSGDEVLTLRGDVTLVMPTYYSSADALSVTGNAKIVIADGAQVTMYIEGDIKIAGNGIYNTNGVPKDLIIHGTNESEGLQTIEISGNGELKAAVNAPNAEVSLGGGGVSGSVSGSIVGYNITLNGDYPFHYDEALKKLGGDNPMRLGLWRELTSVTEQLTF